MALLQALCGDKHDLTVKEVPLNASAQEDVGDAFAQQEAAFRAGDEVPFDQDWLNEGHEIVTAPIPSTVDVFARIDAGSATAIDPIDTGNLDEIRGLAMRLGQDAEARVLVQLFAASQSLTRPALLSLLYEGGTYTRLQSPGFRLDDKLVCIAEHGLIKFRSLHNLGRVIDTSAIFSAATDSEVTAFATTYSSIFDIADVIGFVDNSSRNARKYMASLAKTGVLQNHTAQTLQAASAGTNLNISINNNRIVMPTRSGEVTELMRFLNDGRYVGPISGNPFITNSRRPAP